MQKSFGVESIVALGEAGSGQFEAVVSVFDNVDGVKDVVMSHGFDRALKEQEPPPVVWSHYWDIPPIGNTIDWGKTERGLGVKGELFVGADDKHQYADMVYAAMKSRGDRKPALREFSFSYDIPDGGMKIAEREGIGKVQELHEIFPVFEVGPTFKGCNPATELVTPPKRYAAELDRLQRIAQKRGVSLKDLLDELEAEGEDDSVRTGTYPPEVAELLLAVPTH